MTGNGGITQNMRWGGGGYALTLNNNKQTTNSTTSTLNPAYNTTYSAQYTQPLMRGFKIDSTRQSLVVTKLNQEISETQLQMSGSSSTTRIAQVSMTRKTSFPSGPSFAPAEDPHKSTIFCGGLS